MVIIYGTIDENGGTTRSGGWANGREVTNPFTSVSRNGEGKYTVKLGSYFSGNPTVTATAMPTKQDCDGGTSRTISVTQQTATQICFAIKDNSDSDYSDRPFNFIAIGD